MKHAPSTTRTPPLLLVVRGTLARWRLSVASWRLLALKNKLLLLAPYTVRAVARKRSGRESRAPIPTPSALPRAQKRRRGQAARRGALRI